MKSQQEAYLWMRTGVGERGKISVQRKRKKQDERGGRWSEKCPLTVVGVGQGKERDIRVGILPKIRKFYVCTIGLQAEYEMLHFQFACGLPLAMKEAHRKVGMGMGRALNKVSNWDI